MSAGSIWRHGSRSDPIGGIKGSAGPRPTQGTGRAPAACTVGPSSPAGRVSVRQEWRTGWVIRAGGACDSWRSRPLVVERGLQGRTSSFSSAGTARLQDLALLSAAGFWLGRRLHRFPIRGARQGVGRLCRPVPSLRPALGRRGQPFQACGKPRHSTDTQGKTDNM